MVRVLLIDFVGATAGALALSIALYLQFIKEHVYSGAYIMGLYLMGTVLLHVNLQPMFIGSDYWNWIRFVLYVFAIIIEVVTWHDLKDGEPEIIRTAQEMKHSDTDED